MIDEAEVIRVLGKLIDDEKERTKKVRSDYTAGYLAGLRLAISLTQFHATLASNVSRETLEAAHDDV